MGSIRVLAGALRRWRLIAGLTAVGVVVAFATLPASPQRDRGEEPERYGATHTLLKDTTSSTTRRSTTNQDVTDPALDTTAGLVRRGEVAGRAAEILGVDDELALARTVRTSTNSTLGTIDISAEADDPERAVAVADAFAQGLLDQLVELANNRQESQRAVAEERLARLQVQIDALDAQLGSDPQDQQANSVLATQRSALLDRYRVAFNDLQDLQVEVPTAGFSTLARATPSPIAPDSGGFAPARSRLGRTAIGLIAGLVLGSVAAIVAARLDPRIFTREEAEAALGMPVIAEVPRLPRRLRGRHRLPPGEDTFAEAFRMLRTSLLVGGPAGFLHPLTSDTTPEATPQRNGSKRLRTLLVTSGGASEGKTTVVAGLGRALARADRTMLVDLDLRQSDLHTFFDVPLAPGVGDLLRGDGTPRSVGDVVAEPEPGLLVCPAGDPAPHIDLFPGAVTVLHDCRRLAEVIVVDSPPALAVSDPGELIPSVDAVLVVCFAGRTSAESAARLSELLARLGATVAGAVLVGVRPSRAANAYYRSRPASHEAAPSASSTETAVHASRS